MKSGFLDKLIERWDRLDPKSIQTQFLHLVQERGLLETIFQSIQEGVIVIDRDGKLTYANRAAELLLGFSLVNVRGRPASKALRDMDWNRIMNLDSGDWSKLVQGEIEVTYPEHRALYFYAVPLAQETSGSEGAVLILRDVTQERAKEATTLESERFNAVKLLAAGVAHEIGNPLNALNIHLQLLQREIRGLPEPQRETMRELVGIAGTEVARLDAIISQFLKALRPSRPNLALLQIEKVIEETLLLLRQEIQDRAVEVVIESPGAMPKVPADRDQMKQVFFNIIKNAFQAMPGGGQVRIALSLSDRFLAICFEDNGKGIEADELARIFEPYHTTKPDGSGLGLMIVQRIVQDHGGQIEVESKPGCGTRFTVLLPLAERRVRLLNTSGNSMAGPAGAAGITGIQP